MIVASYGRTAAEGFIEGTAWAVLFGLIILTVWLVRWVRSSSRRAKDVMKSSLPLPEPAEESLYAAAMKEVETGGIREGLWAKAFAKAKGDENKAKAFYIEQRVREMRLDERTQEPEANNETFIFGSLSDEGWQKLGEADAVIRKKKRSE